MASSSLQQNNVDKCFEELMSVELSLQKISNIIDQYSPVIEPKLPTLNIFSSNLNKITESKLNGNSNFQELEEEFYEEKFVPSPDLLLNYQQIFIKSVAKDNQTAFKTPIMNNKLQNLYQTALSNSNPYAHQNNSINTPTTIPYRTLTPNYNFFPITAENPRVFVQQRQQTILHELKKQAHGLQVSIPMIQNSLMQNQIKRLQEKDIKLENMTGVKGWKMKREELLNKLGNK